MPDKPYARLVHQAFQTPAGLTAQGFREQTSLYAESQASARQLDQRTDGLWLDMPYAPGRFTAFGGTLFTVPKSNVVGFRYKVCGRELRMSLLIVGTLAAASAYVQIQLPERLRIPRAAAWHTGVFAGADGTGATMFFAQCEPGAPGPRFYRVDGNTIQPGTVVLRGQMFMEVEEF